MPEQGRVSHEVIGLIDRIRERVSERRRLEGGASSERLRATTLEIERLQRRLATVVRRELTQ